MAFNAGDKNTAKFYYARMGQLTSATKEELRLFHGVGTFDRSDIRKVREEIFLSLGGVWSLG